MPNNRKFTSSTKFNYFRGITPNMVKKPNSYFYSSLFGNALLANEIYNFDNNNPSPPVPPKPVYDTKIVALLNFSDQVYDVPIIDTLKYYFNAVNQFYVFPIVDTQGDTTKIINLLDEYYAKGYRYFYGFSTTTVFLDVLDWFNKHPLAQGVSSGSRYSTTIPTSIFRLQPENDNRTSAKQVIENYNGTSPYDSVFYVYNNTDPSSVVRKEYFESRCTTLAIPFYSYGVTSISDITTGNFVNNTMVQIQNTITTNSYTNSSVISSLELWQNVYYNKFSASTTTPSTSTFYNIDVYLPNITETAAQEYFKNIDFYAQTLANLNSSPLFRQGLAALRPEKFSYNTLNAMELLYKLDSVSGYSNQLGSYSDSLIFDSVTRNQLFDSYLYSLYSDDNLYLPKYCYYRNQEDNLFLALIET
jgi:hypothetical protein